VVLRSQSPAGTTGAYEGGWHPLPGCGEGGIPVPVLRGAVRKPARKRIKPWRGAIGNCVFSPEDAGPDGTKDFVLVG